MVKVMFLGGPIDHQTRDVITNGGIPVETYHYQEVASAPQFADPTGREWSMDIINTTRYDRHRVKGEGERPIHWWAYIAARHAPTTQDLIDAMPANLKETSHA